MDANTPTGPVRCLLSRLVEIYSTADHSPSGPEFGQELEKARCVAQDLSKLVGGQCFRCQREIVTFLDTIDQLSGPGRTLEDRELIGLMEWAERLHEVCSEVENSGNCPGSWDEAAE